MDGLVQVSVVGPEGSQTPQAPRPVSGLLAQLPLCPGLRALAGPEAPPRDLPAELPGDVAVLPDQQDLVRRHERDDARAPPQAQHGVQPPAPIRALLLILPDGRMPAAVQQPAPHQPPRLHVIPLL